MLVAVRGEQHLAGLEALKLRAAARKDILVIDRDLGADERTTLSNACDCS